MSYYLPLYNFILPKNTEKKPTSKQLSALFRFIKNSNVFFNELSIEKWVEAITDEEFDRIPLFPKGAKSSTWEETDRIINDLMVRAETILDKAIAKEKGIIYFDGHGRLTYYILRYYIEVYKPQGIALPKMTVIDMDRNCHKWHKLFFPNVIKCRYGDIFNYLTAYYFEENVVYFNFCGVSIQTTDRVVEWYNICTSQNIGCNIFISGAPRNGFSQVLPEKNYEVINKRQRFETYYLH